ncbi:MAG: hypothetical protein KatS3mg104_0210 [Phycisphaerae bacterium]|jgi:hypothetical protein|nr:MAG: hypothetical protein KatS3mg104_0210 [Phycisphaerae bacterium]
MNPVSDIEVWVEREQIRRMGDALKRPHQDDMAVFADKGVRRHLEAYARGLISGLPR